MAEGTGNGSTSSYDKRSFLSGVAVGRQLKGWATGGNAGGGGTGSLSITANGIYDVKRYAQAVVDVPPEAASMQNVILLSHSVLVLNTSELSPITFANVKLVPESMFDVTGIVE